MCRFRGERHVDQIDHLESQELRLHRGRFSIVAKPLQDLGEDDSGQADSFVIQVQIKPLGFRIGGGVEKIDPDRGIDDNQQSGLTVATHRVQIAFPFHLAAQPANPGLATRLNQ